MRYTLYSMKNDNTHMETKKIAIIIDTLNGGGAEKVCLTLTKAFNENGIESHLIVLKRKCSYTLQNKDHVHFIYDDANIKLYRKSVQLDAAKKLNSLVYKLGGFDAYFSNLDNCHPIVARACLPNCLYVIHNSIEHILKASKQLGPLKYRQKLNVFKSLDNKNIITVSNGIKEEIEARDDINAKSITTIYNPIDIEDIHEKSLITSTEIPSSPYIVYAGRIATQKRLDVLIKAFQQLESDVALVILSNNPQRLNTIIKRHNSNNKNIIVSDFKQNPYPWIKNAQALVLSSDFEGLGMVLIEALALGTPVASTDCPHGPKEIMTGELEQYLAPPGDYEVLAKKIDNAIGSTVNTPKILAEVELKKVVQKYLESTKKNDTSSPLKITFYLPNYGQLEKLDTIDPYSSWQEMPRGEGFWILQTYCFLKHFGLDVKISSTLPSEGVLVFHRRNKSVLFNEKHRDLNKLILVGCRGDLHDMHVPDFELLQNSYFADYNRRFPMPHWPMPGIVPREKSRGNTIKRIAFKGFSAQLHPDFKTQEWLSFLESLGIEWVQNDVAFTHEGGSQFDNSVWADYSDIDLIIAVRPERNELHTNKPALKLYNAWHAGVPAILGNEYAYREIGIDGEDYIEANCLEDAKTAISRLIEEPKKYRAMIERGKMKAHLYTHHSVFLAWQHFFNTVLPEKIIMRKKQLSYKAGRFVPIRARYFILSFWKWITLQRTR